MRKLFISDVEELLLINKAQSFVEEQRYGKAEYVTIWQRHYFLKRLLELQLKEFDHG